MVKTEQVEIGPYTIEVHYKKMKNIYLKIKPDGTIILSVPFRTSQTYINNFLKGRLSWIEQNLAKLHERHLESPKLAQNEMFLFGKISSQLYSETALQQLLHKQISHYINEYWPYFQSKGCSPVQIKYRKMTATWGICRPGAGTITFSKALIHQPYSFIEYVVVHELCHLLVPNHSRQFYRLVGHLMPHHELAKASQIIT